MATTGILKFFGTSFFRSEKNSTEILKRSNINYCTNHTQFSPIEKTVLHIEIRALLLQKKKINIIRKQNK